MGSRYFKRRMEKIPYAKGTIVTKESYHRITLNKWIMDICLQQSKRCKKPYSAAGMGGLFWERLIRSLISFTFPF